MQRACMFLGHNQNVRKLMIMKEWHRVAHMLAAKHDKVCACACCLRARLRACLHARATPLQCGGATPTPPPPTHCLARPPSRLSAPAPSPARPPAPPPPRPQVRYAMAFWIGERLSLCFDTWRGKTQARRTKNGKLRAAALTFYKGSMTKAFNRWKNYALHKVRVARVWGVGVRCACCCVWACNARVFKGHAARDSRTRSLARLPHAHCGPFPLPRRRATCSPRRWATCPSCRAARPPCAF